MMADLTEPQQKMLDTINGYIAEHGQSPMLKELMTITCSTKSGVADMLKRLEKLGVITRTPYDRRGIKVVES